MTAVAGRAAGPVDLDGYDDLTGGTAPTSAAYQDGITTLTFPTVLTYEQADAVWQRLTSRDAADQAARNTLRTRIGKVLAETPPTPTRGLLLHLAGLVLGDEYGRPTPPPASPEEPTP